MDSRNMKNTDSSNTTFAKDLAQIVDEVTLKHGSDIDAAVDACAPCKKTP